MTTLVNSITMRSELQRARRFARRITPDPAEAPLPPPLPSGRVVQVPGRGEVFLREQVGDAHGPTILLLHGWTASADLNFFTMYDDVSALGRLLAVDHRGHGRGIRTDEPFTLEAAADDVAGLLEHLGTGPCIVVGYSMGGPITALLAQRHPHLVRGVVFEATALEWRASRRERLMWRFMAIVELVLRLGPSDRLVERFLREVFDEQPELRQYRGWLRGELRRGDAAAQAEAGRALGQYDARSWIASVDMPAAVVVTTADRLVKPRKQRALAGALRDARLVEIDADHDAPLMRPRQLADATVEAIRHVVGSALDKERRSAVVEGATDDAGQALLARRGEERLPLTGMHGDGLPGRP